ncbi:metallophosphoesterase [Sporosarcina sp. CAU 1771]
MITHKVDICVDARQSVELNVFFISDIHRRKIDDKLLSKIGNVTIDLVIIGGDLAEKGVPISRISENIRKLSRLGPIYFIWGNNDREAGEIEIRNVINMCGGVILDNENAPIPGHPSWGILGTDDPSSRNVDIPATLKGIENYKKTILVTHTPALFGKVERIYHPDIMLAGHTHGGQIRIGKFGLLEIGSFKMKGNRAQLVSNGFGTSTLPLRLGAMPECHIIQIRY